MSATVSYDDRIDTDTELSLGQTLALVGRSLALISKVKSLFACKFVFALVAILPPVIFPWFLKIVVDQVILQQPFSNDVRFPPFMLPLIAALRDSSPSDIMLSLSLLFFVLLFFFGMRAWPTEQAEREALPAGHDAATQSEQALSAGGSKTGGL